MIGKGVYHRSFFCGGGLWEILSKAVFRGKIAALNWYR